MKSHSQLELDPKVTETCYSFDDSQNITNIYQCVNPATGGDANLILAWLIGGNILPNSNCRFIFLQNWSWNSAKICSRGSMCTFENHINFLQLAVKLYVVFFNFIWEWTERLRNDKIEQNGQSFRKFRKLTCWERRVNKYYILEENWNYSTKSGFKTRKIKSK